jgi:hypothetical protein
MNLNLFESIQLTRYINNISLKMYGEVSFAKLENLSSANNWIIVRLSDVIRFVWYLISHWPEQVIVTSVTFFMLQWCFSLLCIPMKYAHIDVWTSSTHNGWGPRTINLIAWNRLAKSQSIRLGLRQQWVRTEFELNVFLCRPICACKNVDLQFPTRPKWADGLVWINCFCAVT